MRWPIHPIEIQRRFAPPFCPRRACPQHTLTAPRRFAYQRFGSFRRADGRLVPRYRCTSCRRTFSKQAFAVSYYLKRPELLAPVAAALVGGAAHRQIARLLGCAPSTVTRLSARLGRHGLLLQVLALSHLPRDREDTVLDHAEAFEGSQDAPIAIATLVGARSWFWYGLEGSTHRRTGRRRPPPRQQGPSAPRRHTGGGYVGSAARALQTRVRFSASLRPLRVSADARLRTRRRPPGPARADRPSRLSQPRARPQRIGPLRVRPKTRCCHVRQ